MHSQDVPWKSWALLNGSGFHGIEEHDHEDVIPAMMEAFEQAFHGIQFAVPDEGYYETQDGLSCSVNPTYVHDWNQAGSEIKLQSRKSLAHA
jgi:hypothetical protein